jgi:outer membrane biosynthesis protein TonB
MKIKHVLAVLLHRPIEVTSPQGMRFNLWLRDRLVLPVIAGGDETDEEKAAKATADAEAAAAKEAAAKEDETEETEEEDEETEEEKEAKGAEETDWKKMARKHENRAKAAERKLKKEQGERKKLEDESKKRGDAEKTEHEKAVDKAREEGKQEALTVSEKVQRKSNLEVAVTRLASKGVKVGDGDNQKTIRFSDPEDAQTFLDRNIAKGEVDEEDIFGEDGKVNGAAVQDALVTILEEKPVLGAEFKPRPKGEVDAGKGKSTGKDLEEMTPEEHFQRIRKTT